MAAWRFVSVPKKLSAEIRDSFEALARGWGSLRVVVTVGKTSWQTSIFPDKKSGTYVLPLKAAVRKKENIADNTTIACEIEVKV